VYATPSGAMKILLVAHGFPRRHDDLAGAFLLALARGQQSLGNDVLVVAPHDAGLPFDDVVDGVRVRRYRYASDAEETLAYRGTMADQVLRSWSGRRTLIRFIFAARHAMRKAAREFEPDVIHVHWWFPGGLSVWPRLSRRRPFVLTSHGTDLFLVDRMTVASRLAGPIFRAAAEVTVISSPLVARAERLGVPRGRISIIPMPIDRRVATEVERPLPPTIVRDTLLFVGRLVERKGAAYAVQALAELVRGGRSVRLVIVGEGPEREALRRLATALGVADRIELAGALSPADVRARYAAGGIFVMPAITDWKGEQEGFGMVIVEAMAYGLPVVASRSGGIPDIIRDGENGLLVPERDVPALVAAVTRVIEDDALALRLASIARDDVRHRFSPARIATAFDTVYRRAMRQPD
jgi:glycosyltransferase involved in cell wall biosynthesis